MLPHPQAEYRPHRTVDTGDFAPGTAILQAAFARIIIPIASAGRFRFRMKATVGGTLRGKIVLPGIQAGLYTSFTDLLDGNDFVATTGNPADVTVPANTEALLEVNDLSGEAYILIEFEEANAGAGVITYANYCQL